MDDKIETIFSEMKIIMMDGTKVTKVTKINDNTGTKFNDNTGTKVTKINDNVGKNKQKL